MSYDIHLEADLGGPAPIPIWAYDWNYTTNCAPMWRAAGANLAEFDGKPAGECAEILRDAIAELVANPEKYRAMDPENGWGSYDSLLPALRKLLEGFDEAPRAIVRVSR